MSEQKPHDSPDTGAEHGVQIPLTDLMRIRRDKLHKLAAMGINPYPYRYERTHQIADVLAEFDKLAEQGAKLRICGRIYLGTFSTTTLTFTQIMIRGISYHV